MASVRTRLLVTGAGGFVGAAVVTAAVERGWDVIALSRGTLPARLASVADRIGHRRADMADHADMLAILVEERPEVIVHSAWGGVAASGREAAAQVDGNVIDSCRLVEAAGAAGVAKFVGIGSQAEYGRLDHPINEADLPNPTSLYGAAKQATFLLGSVLAAQAGMSFAWLRLFAAYGPGDNPNWLIPSLAAQLRAGQRPRLTPGTQRWDYLYIDDVAGAVLDVCATPDATGAFNLSAGSAVPIRTIAEKLRDRLAPGLDLVFGEVPFGPAQIMHLEGRNDRLRAATGWAPRVDLDTGLDRTVAAP